MAEEEARAGTERLITDYGTTISPVISFKYLGRILLAADGEWAEVLHNLQRAQQKWSRLSQVLIREGSDAWTSGGNYVAVVQAVMIYRLETWATTLHIKRVLGGFHHRVA